MSKKLHRALAPLHELGRICPDIWLAHDIAKSERTWPEYVFAPIEITRRVLDELRIQIGPREHLLAAMVAWRPTQGIYRFAPALLDAVLGTPVTGEIPREVLHRIPEWCIYLEVEREIGRWQVHGAWAHLDSDLGAVDEALRLVVLHDDDVYDTYNLLLTETLDTSLARAEFRAPDGSIASLPLEHFRSVIESLVSLLLYVCSTNAEIRDPKSPSRIPSRPRVHVDKHGRSRWYAAQQATIWETGTRLGARLDAANVRTTSSASSPTGKTVRPHVRRAHWHHVWTGPRDDPQKRQLILKWLSPILVNLDEGDEPNAATIRPVGGGEDVDQ